MLGLIVLALTAGNVYYDSPVDMYTSYSKAVYKQADNLTTFQTSSGNFYKAVDGIQLGSECFLVMDGNFTADPKDDEILYVEPIDFDSDNDW